MNPPQGRRHLTDNGLDADLLGRDRAPFDETGDEDALGEIEMHELGPDSEAGSHLAGRHLTRPIDAEQLGPLPGQAHDEDLSCHLDLVVGVRDAPAKRRHVRRHARPDGGDDRTDRRVHCDDRSLTPDRRLTPGGMRSRLIRA